MRRVYPYLAAVGTNLGPAVSVSFVRQDGTMTRSYRAMLDSGCDVTTFPTAMGPDLQIDISKCQVLGPGLTASGRDADPATYPRLWPAGVDVIFQHERLHVQAMFRAGLPVILLGRDDFFSYFKIEFDQRAKTFSLERYP